MPVSSTATTTDDLPRSVPQAVWMPGTPRIRSFSALALLPPAGRSHHWPRLPVVSGNIGSFGVTSCWRCSRSLGTTHSTSARWRRRCARACASSAASGRAKRRSCALRPDGRIRASPRSAATPASASTRRMRPCSACARAAPAADCATSCAGASFSLTISPCAGRGSSAWAASKGSARKQPTRARSTVIGMVMGGDYGGRRRD